QLLMSLHGSLLVRSARAQPWRRYGAVWVRPDAAHEVDACGGTLLIGFINARSDVGAALARTHRWRDCVCARSRSRRLWLRLQRTACDLLDGASVTSAANRAGFSDAAHLTRMFRRMLGATPSDLALLKVSLGFSVDSSEDSDRVAREINVIA